MIMIYVLSKPLHCCIQYRIVVDRVMTARLYGEICNKQQFGWDYLFSMIMWGKLSESHWAHLVPANVFFQERRS